ncbi:hypothetical protein AVEN_181878-1 [Araneus ventricosus]|uniref:Uncharacterized protein n=1 Tax=Araneus ventricosus TaxID=182803 RepID=A0A4Y2NR19_ARAVE|nr:hypothetical protein AVEN_225076-1 [Araneus ventricosus]GBN41293.1 hypothetical protein AVEN_181878-1 [Araneus ventricosus]
MSLLVDQRDSLKLLLQLPQEEDFETGFVFLARSGDEDNISAFTKSLNFYSTRMPMGLTHDCGISVQHTSLHNEFSVELSLKPTIPQSKSRDSITMSPRAYGTFESASYRILTL